MEIAGVPVLWKFLQRMAVNMLLRISRLE